jgi:hypothetical protein
MGGEIRLVSNMEIEIDILNEASSFLKMDEN